MTGRDATGGIHGWALALACVLAMTGATVANAQDTQTANRPDPKQPTAPPASTQVIDPARIDRLIDATQGARLADLTIDPQLSKMRASLGDDMSDAAARSRLTIDLVEFMRTPTGRAIWRDAIARTLPVEILEGAERFFATPVGRAYTACVSRASTLEAFRRCGDVAIAADDTGAAVRFTALDLFDRYMGPDTHQALACRALEASEDLRTRLFAVCRLADAPPACMLVKDDADGQRLDPRACAAVTSPPTTGSPP